MKDLFAGGPPPSAMMDADSGPRKLSEDEAAHKRALYEKMPLRRRKFIDRIGFDAWDPFAAPKEPMDIRVDVSKRTTQELLREFLQSVEKEKHGNDYARGALECALGVVNREEKYRGIFDFCLWYHSLLTKEQKTI